MLEKWTFVRKLRQSLRSLFWFKMMALLTGLYLILGPRTSHDPQNLLISLYIMRQYVGYPD